MAQHLRAKTVDRAPGTRYARAPASKTHGATYTPKTLADFVAREIVRQARLTDGGSIRVLDPAVGDGELLVSLLEQLRRHRLTIELHGFETDGDALRAARDRLARQRDDASVQIEQESFLSFVLKRFHDVDDLFTTASVPRYDIVIANPPYVRTQVMGASQAQRLAHLFNLSGRVDLYHAFILGISRLLADTGVAGIIVSNRFMTTKSGASVRAALTGRFDVLHAWDLGDTKLFDAAVLPAVLLAHGGGAVARRSTRFTSIYQTNDTATTTAAGPIEALEKEGVVAVDDGRRFIVRHGELDTGGTSNGVWRIATKTIDNWLAKVEHCRWRAFGQVGKIRVGVKTCADRVFIRDDWRTVSDLGPPELLRPLTTHHIARQYKALAASPLREILYPHETSQGRRRPVDLDLYPISKAYLDQHRTTLERRRYVTDAGRAWYEIWVPQDPSAWSSPKLVFRDIAEKPAFWMDFTGSVVNGDCYWLTSDLQADGVASDDLLWLAAAIGNSTFIERFYDYRFNNRLYAGRRRFATQYVEEFPLPNPRAALGRAIIEKAKHLFESIESPCAGSTTEELDSMVWEAFDLQA